ncbi:MAG: methylenetetrahydrofolate reductase [Candidatus Thorarchaeota archaeon]
MKEGDFVVTAEVRPPKGTDRELLIERIRTVKDYCDAINVTDNLRGIPLMSSLVCAHYVLQENAEPIMQMTSRDRNRIMVQSDLYGAYALGVRNVLFMKGDHPSLGTHPDAQAVYDLDTVEAVALANMLELGYDMVGDELEGTPSFFVGSTFNPCDSSETQLSRLRRKVDAGARFFQTQAIFDVPSFGNFMERLEDFQVNTLVGIIPLRNPEIAEFMDEKVQGIDIPPELIQRLKEAGDGLEEEELIKAYEEEGLRIALEIIEDIKRVKSVSGIHLMGVGWIESVPALVKEAKLYPRPKRG